MLNNLTYQIMCEIGLEIDNEMRVVDQDFGNVIMFKGKSLKASNDPLREPFIGRNDIFFDPVNNFKLMSGLFQYYIQKLSNLEGRYFNIFYPVQLPSGKTYIEIKENMNPIRSGSYFNPCIAYIDLIFRLNGEEYDLSVYDSMPQVFAR